MNWYIEETKGDEPPVESGPYDSQEEALAVVMPRYHIGQFGVNHMHLLGGGTVWTLEEPVRFPNLVDVYVRVYQKEKEDGSE